MHRCFYTSLKPKISGFELKNKIANTQINTSYFRKLSFSMFYAIFTGRNEDLKKKAKVKALRNGLVPRF